MGTYCVNMDVTSLFPPLDKEWHKVSKKRYGSQFMRGEFDRLPVDPMMLAHSTVACGYRIRDFYENPQLGSHCLAYIQELYDLLPVTKYYFSHPWLTELGLVLKPMEFMAPVPDNVAVSSPEDVDNLRVPDVAELEKGYTYNRLVEGYTYIQKNMPERFVPMAYCPEPVGSGAALCGLEQFLMYTIMEMDIAQKLVRTYVDTAINGAAAIAKRYGMAMISTGAVFANSDIMSPETIKALSPHNVEYLVKQAFMRGAGPQVFYHFCGNHGDDIHLFHNIVFAPFTIMHIGYKGQQPFPADLMKEMFGKKATIMPSVDTKLFTVPNPKAIYEQAKWQLLAGRDSPNGFILGTCCEVPPMSPPGNILALIRAAEDFGRYGDW